MMYMTNFNKICKELEISRIHTMDMDDNWELLKYETGSRMDYPFSEFDYTMLLFPSKNNNVFTGGEIITETQIIIRPNNFEKITVVIIPANITYKIADVTSGTMHVFRKKFSKVVHEEKHPLSSAQLRLNLFDSFLNYFR